ncbi:YdiK family protein [Aquibacillus sp. 3ASR75-11]|uniref:YdiK family protein n=1 Tax=Terrihalobacillus insolitus TaxID=2950438 RepID=A0A9X3WWS7_9BACI|nr:YdiK family protein [Terrihalobacillus insolitus]MDC3414226.1 YdiK family protein [Terrihalobacillus insolitus]MDC3426223.1 YdiK family protein [Terrihalobacillus insolitus]
MRTSPLFMASLYFFMGVVFTYIGTQSASNTVWNFTTIILSVVATFDFVVAIRLFLLHFRIKKTKRKKK